MSSTPRYGHPPIAMRLRDDEETFERIGDFRWGRNPEGHPILAVAIPAGADDRWVSSRWTINHKNHCGAQWSWDGHLAAPTLAPSLHAVGVWHGYVRGGKLVEA